MTAPPVGPSLFGRLLRQRERRATIGVLIVAVVVAATCWYFGADAWYSILIGIALTTVGAVGLAGTARPDLSNINWRRGSHPNRQGARSDVAELSWSLHGSHGRVDGRAVWRVQRLAQQRLARYQLSLRNPADRREIEQLIGHRAYVVLVRGARRPPFLRSFMHCLDALDALDPTRPSEPPSGPRRRPSIFSLNRPRRAREP